MLNLFAVFHLNLAYSSIDKEKHREVLGNCYWPLLRLASEHNLPFGIEASGYTLETISRLDRTWIERLCYLTTEGPCEFIGSGFAQLVGPLAPSEVNMANLRLGHQVYDDLLGFRPRIALVNEQAYSAGLLQHYLDAGYEAIIMEWDNPALYHKEWDPDWRYLPQYACGQHGEKISLIWNNSIAFQKFQRYVHGDLELEEYLDFLLSQSGKAERALPLYGNDVEIFDFRPGRYHTEAAIQAEGEWVRIEKLLKDIMKHKELKIIKPSGVLKMLKIKGAGNCLRLESPEQPVPVKKQGKYNITRWAVTGRDDLGINTRCWRIYEALKKNAGAPPGYWRELCFLWSSDFRTHITESRWAEYLKRIEALGGKVGVFPSAGPQNETPAISLPKENTAGVKQKGDFLIVKTGAVMLKINCRRGLAIDGLWLGTGEELPLLGTLRHGYYDNIALGSDWYSGHTVLEVVGRPKITDLNPVKPEKFTGGRGTIIVQGSVATPLGPVYKRILVDPARNQVILSYEYEWSQIPLGSFRLGYVTLNPKAFDRSSLYYETCNGGSGERHYLAGKTVEHGKAVSFLVSAQGGIGVTEGWVEVGDKNKCLRLEIDKTLSALVGLVSYYEVNDLFFCRVAFSAGELDETRRHKAKIDRRLACRLNITAFVSKEGRLRRAGGH